MRSALPLGDCGSIQTPGCREVHNDLFVRQSLKGVDHDSGISTVRHFSLLRRVLLRQHGFRGDAGGFQVSNRRYVLGRLVRAGPRDEIRPEFSFEPKGGPKQAGSFVIRHDKREGLDGWIQRSFAVTGGEFYRFEAVRKLTDVAVPRRSALVRILWQNDAGGMVNADVSKQQIDELGHLPSAEPEHPADGATDSQGWTTVSGVYRAPTKATRAVIELHLQWAAAGDC